MEEKRLEFILLGIGVLLIGIGVYVFNKGDASEISEIIQESKDPIIQNKEVVIEVAGEVEKPGVFSLVLGARVGEAIASAGGITQEADSDWVEKNLNQAKVLTDGEKIYIPTKNESNNLSMPNSQLVNINTASEGELDKLPGVGPVTAQKIISNRPYANIVDLKTKQAVSEKVYDQIKDLISTW